MNYKLYFSFLFAACLAQFAAKATHLVTDTVTIAMNTQPKAQIVNNETPTILKRGETLTVTLDATSSIKSTVRIHSSLGKLVKEFVEVEKQISMLTDRLLPGVYLVIIKQKDKREIRKFLITE